MNKSFEKEKGLETLVEELIKMLGKTNERLCDMNKRITQLELIIKESNICDYNLIDPPLKNMKIS